VTTHASVQKLLGPSADAIEVIRKARDYKIEDRIRDHPFDKSKPEKSMGSEELVSYRMYQLDKVVTEIKELYDVTSTKTMSDLLLAYSGHMNRVLKDLKVIKQDAAHEKFELRKH
jgi:hypothetical protein